MLAFLVALALLCLGCSFVLPTSDDLAGGEGGNAGTSAGCPGTHGPEMVNVGSYCIDSTEVTSSQYQAFLDANLAEGDNPEISCTSGNDYLPAVWPPDGGLDDRPVVEVDWCDAAGFCGYAGKRLCGGTGGVPITEPSYEASFASDEWLGACLNGGATTEAPYGDEHVDGVCNQGPDLAPVKSFAGCRGQDVYANVYDLGGNVSEWVNVCDGGYCRQYGGVINLSPGDCSTHKSTQQLKDQHAYNTGFRCCADSVP
jgi:formylglycine-generating enzyme required for sulfatase activity